MPASTIIGQGVIKFVADTAQLPRGMREIDALNQSMANIQRSAMSAERGMRGFRKEAAATEGRLRAFARSAAMAGQGILNSLRVHDFIGSRLLSSVRPLRNISAGFGVLVPLMRTGWAYASAFGGAIKSMTGFLWRGVRAGHRFILWLRDIPGIIRFATRVIEQYWKPALAGMIAGIGALTVNVVRVGERFASFDARLRLLAGAGDQFVQSQREILRIANETGTALALTYELYIDVFDAVRQVGRQTTDTAKIVAALGRSFVISGTAAQDQSRGIRQFLQALRSDPFLRAQEFDTLAETNPRLIRLLRAEFAPELNRMGVGLRRLVTDGMVPMQRVVDALIKELPKLTTESSAMGLTLAASFARIKNAYQSALVAIGRDSGLLEAVRRLAGTLARVVSSSGFRAFAVDIGKHLVTLAAAAAKVADAFLAWYAADPARARETLKNLLLIAAAFVQAYWALFRASPALLRYYVIWKVFGSALNPVLIGLRAFFGLLGSVLGVGVLGKQFLALGQAIGRFAGSFKRDAAVFASLKNAFTSPVQAARAPISALGRVLSALGKTIKVVARLMVGLLRSLSVAAGFSGLAVALGAVVLSLGKALAIIVALGVAVESFYAALINFNGFWGVLGGTVRITLARVLIYTQEALAILTTGIFDFVAWTIRQLANLAAWFVTSFPRLLAKGAVLVLRFFNDVFREGWGAAFQNLAAGISSDLVKYFQNAFRDLIIQTDNYGWGGYRLNIAPLFGLTPEQAGSPILGAIRRGLSFVRDALGSVGIEIPVQITPTPESPGLPRGPFLSSIQKSLREQAQQAEKSLKDLFRTFDQRALTPFAKRLAELVTEERDSLTRSLQKRRAIAEASKDIIKEITSAVNDSASEIARLRDAVREDQIKSDLAGAIALATGTEKSALQAQQAAQIFAIQEIGKAQENLRQAQATGQLELIKRAKEALAIARANVAEFEKLTLQQLEFRRAAEAAQSALPSSFQSDAWKKFYSDQDEARRERIRSYRDAVLAEVRTARQAQQQLIDDFAQPFLTFLENVLTLTTSIANAFRSLANDIARLVIRQTISQPVAGFISGFIANLFKGGNGGRGFVTLPGFQSSNTNPFADAVSAGVGRFQAGSPKPTVVVIEGQMNTETARQLNEIQDGLGDAVAYEMQYGVTSRRGIVPLRR